MLQSPDFHLPSIQTIDDIESYSQIHKTINEVFYHSLNDQLSSIKREDKFNEINHLDKQHLVNSQVVERNEQHTNHHSTSDQSLDEFVNRCLIKDQLILDQPRLDKPRLDHPRLERLISDQSILDGPISNQSISDQLIQNQLIQNQPIQNQPIQDQSVNRQGVDNQSSSNRNDQCINSRSKSGRLASNQIDNLNETITSSTVDRNSISSNLPDRRPSDESQSTVNKINNLSVDECRLDSEEFAHPVCDSINKVNIVHKLPPIQYLFINQRFMNDDLNNEPSEDNQRSAINEPIQLKHPIDVLAGDKVSNNLTNNIVPSILSDSIMCDDLRSNKMFMDPNLLNNQQVFNHQFGLNQHFLNNYTCHYNRPFNSQLDAQFNTNHQPVRTVDQQVNNRFNAPFYQTIQSPTFNQITRPPVDNKLVRGSSLTHLNASFIYNKPTSYSYPSGLDTLRFQEHLFNHQNSIDGYHHHNLVGQNFIGHQSTNHQLSTGHECKLNYPSIDREKEFNVNTFDRKFPNQVSHTNGLSNGLADVRNLPNDFCRLNSICSNQRMNFSYPIHHNKVIHQPPINHHSGVKVHFQPNNEQKESQIPSIDSMPFKPFQINQTSIAHSNEQINRTNQIYRREDRQNYAYESSDLQQRPSSRSRKRPIDESEIVGEHRIKRSNGNISSNILIESIKHSNIDADYNLINRNGTSQIVSNDSDPMNANGNRTAKQQNHFRKIASEDRTVDMRTFHQFEPSRTSSMKRKKLRYKRDQLTGTSKLNHIRWKKFARNKSLQPEDLEQKRNLANTQERRRMLKLNIALDRLRQLMQSRFAHLDLSSFDTNSNSDSNSCNGTANPLSNCESSTNYKTKKLSKIMTLRLAIDYIALLSSSLKN